MTLSAVALKEKEIIMPAIEVAAGELTSEQAYNQYHGLPCGCPHCITHGLETGLIGFSSGQLIDPANIADPKSFQEYTKFVQRMALTLPLPRHKQIPNQFSRNL
jgi:hypothetical protein